MSKSTHTTRRSFLKALPVAVMASATAPVAFADTSDGWGPMPSFITKDDYDDIVIKCIVETGNKAGFKFVGTSDQIYLARNIDDAVDWEFADSLKDGWLNMFTSIPNWRERMLNAQAALPNLTSAKSG